MANQKILMECVVEDILLQLDLDPPAMQLYLSYRVPAMPVMDVHYVPGVGVRSVPAGHTDRVNTSLCLPYDPAVQVGAKIIVSISS